MPTPPKRCGFCAIIGAPNAGKSTLVNQLTGSKVSIVSHKVQTTRARIRAIVMEGNTQIVLVDTPGIFKPKRKLDRTMVDNAWGGAGEADAVVYLVDGRPGVTDEAREIIAQLECHEDQGDAGHQQDRPDAARNAAGDRGRPSTRPIPSRRPSW